MDETCTICMDLPAAGTTVRTLACTHKFCANCLQEWWATAPANSCPTCRKCFASLRSSTVSIAEPAPQQQTRITESAVGAGLVATGSVEQEVRSAEDEGVKQPDSLAAEVDRRGLVRRDSFSSRHMGMSWNKHNKKWQALVYPGGGKREHLGYFATEDEAKARREARCLELGINADAGGSSGFRGVTWDKINRKWQAAIMVDGEQTTLGRFESTARGEVDAALAYDEAARVAGRPGNTNFETAPPGSDCGLGDLRWSGDLDTMKACEGCNSSGVCREHVHIRI
jgi:hypothetical protein